MNDKERGCVREDLQCYVVQSLAFTVSDTGCAENYLDACEYDLGDVDEYVCMNCMHYWTVDGKYDTVARAKAWQAALAHMQPQESGHEEVA